MNLPLTTKQYYIMHSKIFYLIQKYELINNIFDLNPKELIFIYNNYLFIDNNNNNLFIGDINNNLFTSKYVLSYNSKEILDSELKYLLSLNSIREYFKNRNCDENGSNIQKIMNGDKEIGELRILNINKPLRKINNNTYKIKPIHEMLNVRLNSNNKDIKYESHNVVDKENLNSFFQNGKYNKNSFNNKKEIPKKSYEKKYKTEININVNKLFEEINNLKSTLRNKDEEIQSLKDENNQLKKIIKEYELNNEEKNIKMKKLKKYTKKSNIAKRNSNS